MTIEFDRILHGVIGAMIFMFLSLAIPDMYQHVVDPQEYVTVSNVRINSTVYKACDYMIVDFNIDSKITTQANEVINTILLRDGKEYQVDTFSKQARIVEGKESKHIIWRLPCEPIPGEYYQVAMLTYQVNGKTKSFQIITPRYKIII